MSSVFVEFTEPAEERKAIVKNSLAFISYRLGLVSGWQAINLSPAKSQSCFRVLGLESLFDKVVDLYE